MHNENAVKNCREFIHFMGSDNATMFGSIINEIYKISGSNGLKMIERAMEEKGRLDAKAMKDSGFKVESFKDFGKELMTSVSVNYLKRLFLKQIMDMEGFLQDNLEK